jgi:hypothetical protein
VSTPGVAAPAGRGAVPLRKWQLAAVVLAALAIHAFLYHGFEVQTTPDYGDELAHRRIAAQPWSQVLTYYQPLAPAALKCFRAAFGRRWLVRFATFQEGLFILAALLGGSLAWRATGSRWAGAAALVIILADVRLATYQYWALTEILTLFLSLVACGALAAHAVRTSWTAGAIAALTLGFLVLLRSQNVFILPALLAVTAVLSRVGRDWIRRSLPVLTALGLLVSWSAYKHFSGKQMYAQSGFSLYIVLMHHKPLLAELPADDPERAAFARHFTDYAEPRDHDAIVDSSAIDLAFPATLGGIWSEEFNRGVRKAYLYVFVHHPLRLLGTALESFWIEQVSPFQPPYPEDENARRMSPGTVLARRLSGWLFAPFANVLASAVAAGALGALLVRAARLRQGTSERDASWPREILAALCTWVVTDALVTSLFFYPFWPPDRSRMRLHYEAPATVAFIICLALALRWRRARWKAGPMAETNGSWPPPARTAR